MPFIRKQKPKVALTYLQNNSLELLNEKWNPSFSLSLMKQRCLLGKIPTVAWLGRNRGNSSNCQQSVLSGRPCGTATAGEAGVLRPEVTWVHGLPFPKDRLSCLWKQWVPHPQECAKHSNHDQSFLCANYQSNHSLSQSQLIPGKRQGIIPTLQVVLIYWGVPVLGSHWPYFSEMMD